MAKFADTVDFATLAAHRPRQSTLLTSEIVVSSRYSQSLWTIGVSLLCLHQKALAQKSLQTLGSSAFPFGDVRLTFRERLAEQVELIPSIRTAQIFWNSDAGPRVLHRLPFAITSSTLSTEILSSTNQMAHFYWHCNPATHAGESTDPRKSKGIARSRAWRVFRARCEPAELRLRFWSPRLKQKVLAGIVRESRKARQ